jgi:hypothetical protein
MELKIRLEDAENRVIIVWEPRPQKWKKGTV